MTYDPDFAEIERGYDQPPDEPHPRYSLSCPHCGSDEIEETPAGGKHQCCGCGEVF